MATVTSFQGTSTSKCSCWHVVFTHQSIHCRQAYDMACICGPLQHSSSSSFQYRLLVSQMPDYIKKNVSLVCHSNMLLKLPLPRAFFASWRQEVNWQSDTLSSSYLFTSLFFRISAASKESKSDILVYKSNHLFTHWLGIL